MSLALAAALASTVYLELQPLGAHGLGTGTYGTGFVIASTSSVSYVLTAAHVLGCDQFGDNCVDTISLRFPDSPNRVWKAERAYSGTALSNDDLALVIVRRGGLTPLRVASVPPAGPVVELGYPQSRVKVVARGLSADLAPRALKGFADEALSDGRVLLRLSSEEGDSGAPVFDATDSVVAVLQGNQENGRDIAVANKALKDVVAIVQDDVATPSSGASNDPVETSRASLLYRNALKWEKLRSAQMDANGDALLQQAEDQDFADAINAGSADAATSFMMLFSDRISSGYSPPDAVRAAALTRARTAADEGDSWAAYGVYSYAQLMSTNIFTTEHPQWAAIATQYRTLAERLGNPYALELIAGSYGTDIGKVAPVLRRAMAALKPRIDAGDADAAYHYANDYWTANQDQPVLSWGNDSERHESYVRAAELGSTQAISMLLTLRADPTVPQNILDLANRAAPTNANVAVQLAKMYEMGDGVPRDHTKALDLYAVAYHWDSSASLLEEKLSSLVPDASHNTEQLRTSPAFRAARAASVGIVLAGTNASSTVIQGTVVYTDARRSIVATASSAVHCDEGRRSCWQPLFAFLYGSNKEQYGITPVYRSGSTLEHGVTLFELALPNASAVKVVTSPPPLLFSVTYSLVALDRDEAFWGILRSDPSDGNVISCDLPRGFQTLGAGVFDYRTGDLVGVTSDPLNRGHATGPAAIRDALRAIGIAR